MAKKNKIEVEWSLIEADYRADLGSVRQLARKYGVGESTIRGRIRKESWERNLASRVTQLVKDKEARLVGGEVLTADDDAAVIEQAAAEKLGIVKGHRASLTRMDGLYNLLMTRVEGQLKRDQLTVMVKGKPMKVDIPLDYVGKVAASASTIMKNVIELQRVSYKLNDETDDKGNYEQELLGFLGDFKAAQVEEEKLNEQK